MCFELGAAVCRICGTPDYHPDWQRHYRALPDSPFRDEQGTIWTTAYARCSLATALADLAASTNPPIYQVDHRDLIAACQRYWERINHWVPPPPPGPPPIRAAREEAARAEVAGWQHDAAGTPHSSSSSDPTGQHHEAVQDELHDEAIGSALYDEAVWSGAAWDDGRPWRTW